MVYKWEQKEQHEQSEPHLQKKGPACRVHLGDILNLNKSSLSLWTERRFLSSNAKDIGTLYLIFAFCTNRITNMFYYFFFVLIWIITKGGGGSFDLEKTKLDWFGKPTFWFYLIICLKLF